MKNIFPISSKFDLKCTTPLFQDNENSLLTLRTFCKIFNNFCNEFVLQNIPGKATQGCSQQFTPTKLDSK